MNWETLKTSVIADIKTNGAQTITGSVLQSVWLSTIDTIGVNRQFAGAASPTTVPAATDGNVFYIAADPGIYTNFSGLNVSRTELAFLVNTGPTTWVKITVKDFASVVTGFYDGVLVKSEFNLANQLTKVATTYTSGIFESANASYQTSDFIQIDATEDKNYYISWAGTLAASFSLMRFYDANQIEISRMVGTDSARPKQANFKYMLRPPAGTKYIKFVCTVANESTTGLFKALPKTLNDCITEITSAGAPFYENTLVRSDYNVSGQFVHVLPDTWTSGLFESSVAGYQTSSFIELKANQQVNHYINWGGMPSSTYSILRYYDATFIEINRMQGSGTYPVNTNFMYKMTPPRGAVYFKFADTVATQATNGYYQASAATLEQCIAAAVGGSSGFYDSIPLRSDFNLRGHLTVVAPSSWDPGIFESTGTAGYHTSAFIPVTAKAITNYYMSWKSVVSLSFSILRFYNSSQVQIADIKGDNTGLILDPIGLNKLNFPKGTAYIKFADQISGETTHGLLIGPNKSLEQCILDAQGFAIKPRVLWLGTSIPEGAEYPLASCNKLGITPVNNSRGSSYMCFTTAAVTCSAVSGVPEKALCATVAELETKYRPCVTSGNITEGNLTLAKGYSYENLVIPFIGAAAGANRVDAVVIDHGFNDRSVIHTQWTAGKGALVWDEDRTKFSGAFAYLCNKIWAIDPYVKIILCGYFQNTKPGTYYSNEICEFQEWVAEHFEMPILKVWEHSGMTGNFVPNTSTFIATLNSTYGTSFTNGTVDGSGNIQHFQVFCPDNIHPSTDPTGKTNKRLNAIVTKLLRDSFI